MTKNKPNTDLLYATLDRVVAAEPDGSWDQNNWIGYDENLCGTTACFAGHALLAQGATILTRKVTVDGHFTYTEAYGMEFSNGRIITADEVAREAQRALRLNFEQTDLLFNATNDIARIKEVVDEIAAQS